MTSRVWSAADEAHFSLDAPLNVDSVLINNYPLARLSDRPLRLQPYQAIIAEIAPSP